MVDAKSRLERMDFTASHVPARENFARRLVWLAKAAHVCAETRLVTMPPSADSEVTYARTQLTPVHHVVAVRRSHLVWTLAPLHGAQVSGQETLPA